MALRNRFAVGNRNLIIVGVDFAKRKETMTVPAIVNEGRLSDGSTRVTFAR